MCEFLGSGLLVAARGRLGANVAAAVSVSVGVLVVVVGLQAPHGRAGAGDALWLPAAPLGMPLGVLQLQETDAWWVSVHYHSSCTIQQDTFTESFALVFFPTRQCGGMGIVSHKIS